MKGIYKVTNKLNGKVYVSSASNVEKKWHTIQQPGTWERFDKNPFYIDIKAYGIENFALEVIEEVEDDEAMLVREQFWKDVIRPEYNSLSERRLFK